MSPPSSHGGSQPVACLLACNTNFNVHDAGAHDVLWDALYDNFWDFNPLASIPDGLGLTFAFDGSSSLIVPTEAGTWALSYFAERVADTNWGGEFAVGGVGLSFPFVQPRIGTGTSQGTPFMAGSLTAPLPSGTQLTHQVVTDNAASSAPSNVVQVFLSIVRLGTA